MKAYPPLPEAGEYPPAAFRAIAVRPVPVEPQAEPEVRVEAQVSDRGTVRPRVRLDLGVNAAWVQDGDRRSKAFHDGAAGRAGVGDLGLDVLHIVPGISDPAVHFEVHHPHNVASVLIELRACGVDEPVARRRWGGGFGVEQAPIADLLPRVEQEEPAVVVKRFAELFHPLPAELFPDDLLTAERSPYQVRVLVSARATDQDPAERDRFAFPGVAWGYAHVVVHSLVLGWGSEARLGARADLATQWNFAEPFDQTLVPDTVLGQMRAALLQAEKDLLAAVTQKTSDEAQHKASDKFESAHDLALPGTPFRHRTDSSDAGVSGYGHLWGGGPRLPVVAKAMIKAIDGSAADLPAAVGRLRLVWDWDDPRVGTVDPWAAWYDAGTASDLTKRFLKETFELGAARHQPASYNCPGLYGGRHGSDPFFEELPGSPLQPVAGRAWARATALGDAATAEVMLRPSRFPGDTYRVACYLEPPAALALVAQDDLAQAGGELFTRARNAGLPSERSGALVVRRKAKATLCTVPQVAQLGGGDQTWVKDLYLKQAGLELTMATAALDEARLLEADEELCALEIKKSNVKKPFTYLLMRFLVRRDASGCAIAFRPLRDYEQSYDALFAPNRVFDVQLAAPSLPKLTELVGDVLTLDGDGAWRGIVLKVPDGQPARLLVVDPGNGAIPPNGARLKVMGHDTPVQFTSTPVVVTGGAIAAQRDETKNLNGLFDANRYKMNTGPNQPFKLLMFGRVAHYANHVLPADVGAAMIQFEKIRSTDNFNSGSFLGDISTRERAGVLISTPPDDEIADDNKPLKTVRSVLAHELGHAFHLDHAKNTTSTKPNVGENEAEHLHGDACLMNYDHDSDHFCGLCCLKLRGWAYGRVAHRDMTKTIPKVRPEADALPVVLNGAARHLVPVHLSTNKRFAGQGHLDVVFLGRASGGPDPAAFFTDAAGTAALALNAGRASFPATELALGKTIWAEGKVGGAVPGNVVLTLTLDTGESTDLVQVTTVGVALELFQARKPADRTWEAVPADGARVVHKQAAGKHGRARLLVKVTPAAYAGNVRVAGADLAVATQEAGGAAAPHWEGPASGMPSTGLELWIEGAQQAADARLRATLPGVASPLAEVKLQVIELTRLRVTIPATQPVTDRTAGSAPAIPAPTRAAQTFDVQPAWGDAFDPAQTLALLEGGVTWDDQVLLEVTVAPAIPGLPIRWAVTRAAGNLADHKKVVAASQRATPGFTYDVNHPERAKLMLDAVGSFHIRAVVHAGRDTFDPAVDKPPFIALNLVIIKLERKKLDAKHDARRMFKDVVRTPDHCLLHCGRFDNDARVRGINLSATVTALGGGANGRRGLDLLDLGFIQNIVDTRAGGHVPGREGHFRHQASLGTPAGATGRLNQAFAVNVPVGRDYLPGSNPVFVAMPMLDKTLPHAPHQDIGGGQLIMSQNAVASADKSPGRELTVTSNDSPAAPTTWRHPDPARQHLLLERIDWKMSFSAYLCAWTFHGSRQLVVLGRIDWDLDQQWTVDWTNVTRPALGPNGAIPDGTRPALTCQAATVEFTVDTTGPVAAVNTDLETGQPGAHTAQADDARN